MGGRGEVAFSYCETKSCSKISNYAPNFEKVEGAYCFGLVRPSVQVFKFHNKI